MGIRWIEYTILYHTFNGVTHYTQVLRSDRLAFLSRSTSNAFISVRCTCDARSGPRPRGWPWVSYRRGAPSAARERWVLRGAFVQERPVLKSVYSSIFVAAGHPQKSRGRAGGCSAFGCARGIRKAAVFTLVRASSAPQEAVAGVGCSCAFFSLDLVETTARAW